ncbi:MAG: methionine biosynthesis protein MetW [Magnetococcales bacterium]|nr:methionine biosynthesis protein MetW [Magnetococcales bacterium]NGZ26887.1 methionine biosynthesis protein MetW [Magnetococcales bacterium]
MDLRFDQEIILQLVEPGSRILDLGCGDGLLLETLAQRKQVKGFGVEISHDGIQSCMARGLSVQQADIDQGLSDYYKDDSFDYVILSYTLQAVYKPRLVIEEMLRVGKKGIVSFPNFGYWKNRMSLVVQGRMPVNEVLPHAWYETPNIHMCTLDDFKGLCQLMKLGILEEIPVAANGQPMRGALGKKFANLMAPMAVYLLQD